MKDGIRLNSEGNEIADEKTQSMQYVVRFHVGCVVPTDMQPFEDNKQVRPTARTNTSKASVVCSRGKKQDWQ